LTDLLTIRKKMTMLSLGGRIIIDPQGLKTLHRFYDVFRTGQEPGYPCA